MKKKLLFWVSLFFLTIPVSAMMLGDGKGALNIETFPEGVTITLSGKNYMNHVEMLSIDEGSYQCSFRKDGYLPIDTILVVKAGITNYYNIVLSPGRMQSEADVKSGKNRGTVADKRGTSSFHGASKSDRPNMSYLVMLQGTIGKGLSEGGMLGVMYKKNGGYVKGLMTLGSVSNSKIHGSMHGNPLSLDEKYRTKEIVAGYLGTIAEPLIGYVGIGYGHHRTFLKKSEDYYLGNSDAIYRGISFDTGLIFRFRPVLLSVGYNTVKFKAHAVNVGVGVTF